MKHRGDGQAAWIAAWAILLCLLLIVLVLSTAMSNGLIVFDGSRTDLSVILLTASAVILTGVAVAVAIVALWGWQGMKDLVIRAAEEKAAEIAKRVAREVASPVAARSTLEATRTTPEEADQIAQSQPEDGK